jgi:hypothetical protein
MFCRLRLAQPQPQKRYKRFAERRHKTFDFWLFGCGRLLGGRITGGRLLKGENELLMGNC